jgi:hypothetical protein
MVFEGELAQQAINRDRKPISQWNRPARLESLSDPTLDRLKLHLVGYFHNKSKKASLLN